MKPHNLRLAMSKSSRLETSYQEWCTNCRTSCVNLPPHKFRLQLSNLHFTNIADKDILAQQFQSTFNTLARGTSELDFSSMLWGTPQAKDLAEFLPHFKALTTLNLSYNPFGLHGVLALIPQLAGIPYLQSLRLRKCRGLNVTQGVACLSTALPKLEHCAHLDIGCNLFGDAGIAELSSSLSSMKLEKILLDGCGISSSGLGSLKLAGLPIRPLKEGGLDAQQLKDAGFLAKELKDSGFGVNQLREAGFSAAELSFLAKELKAAGHSAEMLKEAGFPAREINEAGYDLRQLREAGFKANQLTAAGYSTEELKKAGFHPIELVPLLCMDCWRQGDDVLAGVKFKC